MSCATRWRLIRWTNAASTSAPRVGRFMHLRMRGIVGTRSFGIFLPWCRSKCRHYNDWIMIRVILPTHLRALANVDREVTVDVVGPITQRTILDALEARYP